MKKNKVGWLIMLICPMLLSCVSRDSPPSAYVNFLIKDAYYNTYIYPNNPDAIKEETTYYKFLYWKKFKEENIYLIAWNKNEEITDWKLLFDNVEYSFSCEINMLVYQFDSKIFISLEESVKEGMYSFSELNSYFKKIPEYISVTYYNR